MAQAGGTRRITDLQRSAFWIYGITAMIMREPLGIVVRHLAESGVSSWQVKLEILRVAVILMLVSRFFLTSGLYFEGVYMRPDSSSRFPRQSYLIDFLFGLMQFLVAAAATTAVGLHIRMPSQLSSFFLLVSLFLVADWVWLGVAVLRTFSSAAVIRKLAWINTSIAASGAVGLLLSRVAGADPVFADQVALGLIAAVAGYDVLRLIREYESLAVAA